MGGPSASYSQKASSLWSMGSMGHTGVGDLTTLNDRTWEKGIVHLGGSPALWLHSPLLSYASSGTSLPLQKSRFSPLHGRRLFAFFNEAIFCCHSELTCLGRAWDNPCSGQGDTGSCTARGESWGRAGQSPWQQGAARLAQAFCETSVDSCELIHYDGLSQDVTGCCILAYAFKNWMSLKALRFLPFCIFWPVSTKGFNLPKTDFGLQDRHSIKPFAQMGIRRIWSHLPCLKTEAKCSNLSSLTEEGLLNITFLMAWLGC